MTRPILRLTFYVGLALCLSLVFTPFGCGGSPQGSVEPARAALEGPQVPPETFSAMMACVTEAKGRLTDTMYALQFDVEVTESGEAGRVKLRDAYPSERALETCLGHALEGMTLPVSVLRRLPKEKAVSPGSRGLMGQGIEEVLVFGAGTSMGPIFLAALGVTVIVVASVYVTGEAIEAVRRRKSKKCLEMYIDCANSPPPCTTPRDWRYLLCSRCMDNCNAPSPYSDSLCTQCGFK